MADARIARVDVSSANFIDVFDAMPTEQLVEEARGLQHRMLGAQHSARDFALVTSMTNRLRRVPTVNREPLEGMLMLDLQPEAAPALSFSRAEAVHV